MKWTEVTRSNFAKTLPLVLDAIKAADFIAFDTELTGLNLTRAHKYNQLDDLQTRYAKLRDSVANFGLLQVGLACFSWTEKRQKFAISAFSFYVFPSAANGLQQERKFSCQLGSLAFLTEHGFDFNKAFKEGIPFITLKEEQIIKSNSAFYRPANSNASSNSTQEPIVLKDDEKAFVGQVLDQIGAWMEAVKSGQKEALSSLQAGNCSFTDVAIDLPPLNSYQRLIFYQQIPLKYGDTLQIVKKTGNVLSIRLAESDPAKKAAVFAEERAQFEAALAEQIGFRRVMDAVAQAKVPMIGHNCLIDLMHFYHKFVDSSFPSQLADFKTALRVQYPSVFDTKFLAKTAGLSETSLGDVTAWAQSMPELSFFPSESKRKLRSQGSVEEENKFHDAAFDSICTGRSFLALLAHSRVKETIMQSCTDPLAIKDHNGLIRSAFGNSALLNRLNVMQSDYEFMQLDGAEVEPDRSNVLLLQGFAGEAQTSEIIAALGRMTPAGPVGVQIKWIDDESCYLYFENRETAESIQEAFKAQKEDNVLKLMWPKCKLLPFQPHSQFSSDSSESSKRLKRS